MSPLIESISMEKINCHVFCHVMILYLFFAFDTMPKLTSNSCDKM